MRLNKGLLRRAEKVPENIIRCFQLAETLDIYPHLQAATDRHEGKVSRMRDVEMKGVNLRLVLQERFS